uniref:Uncharacterized protein n=1 Tax=Kalanchoe fedtschenkoi TaxID=63787 RepID=A0A7N0TEQ7_KALFE
MSEMPTFKPDRSYEGWETIEDDDSQGVEAAANLQHQLDSGPAKWDNKVHLEEHHQYDIVIESPGVKPEPQKVVYEVDDDTDDEATENYNKETPEFTRLARKKIEQEKMAAAAATSDD